MGLVEAITVAAVGIFGIVIAVILGWFRRLDAVQKEMENEELAEFIRRRDAGEKAVRDGRNSGDDPDDRVRGNDDHWN